MITVTVTRHEIAMANAVGRWRQGEAAQRAATAAHGASTDPAEALRLAQFGALGELVAAKGLNLFWGRWETYGAVDVGGLVEVRAVPASGHSLLLHPTDSDDLPFVLVDLSDLPTARLVGWCYGGVGKRLGVWRTDVRSPCYFVKQGHGILRPVAELHRFCHIAEVEGFA